MGQNRQSNLEGLLLGLWWESADTSGIILFQDRNHYVIATQRVFRLFRVAYPFHLRTLFGQLEEAGSTRRGNGHGASKTVKTPINVLLVGVEIDKSSRRSV